MPQTGAGTITAFGYAQRPADRFFPTAHRSQVPVCGFLYAYLWARLYLREALVRADFAAEVRTVLRQQSESDAVALGLAQRVLKPDPGLPEVPQEELTTAVRDASPTMREHILEQAQVMRRENWKLPETKPAMERTIPLFRALVQAAPADHRPRGQLGYALKDGSMPDWEEALLNLNRAIELRQQQGDEGWWMYEFNRALVRMSPDPKFQSGQPSDAAIRDPIIGDLKAAWAGGSYYRKLIKSDPTVQSWLKVNGISDDQLE